MYARDWEQFFYDLTERAEKENPGLAEWLVRQLYEWKKERGEYGFEEEP